MFIVWGINTKEREFYDTNMICPNCGSSCHLQIRERYKCFSLFWIPIIKWGREYICRTSCCGSFYSITRETAKKLKSGGPLFEEELQVLMTNKVTYCPECHKMVRGKAEFCPHCGAKL